MDKAIHIETVDLSSRGVVLPADRVGMVMAQPYLSLTATEPYRCTEGAKQQQLAVLTDTLTVARAARHGLAKTHFTVFPEYSIPGAEGITLVDTALRESDWPNGTIVIGGTDALSRPEFEAIALSPGTHLDTDHNALDRIDQHQWINCGVTWVKASDGTVERWLQPKLHPAWKEMNISYQHMFQGRSVYLFKGLLDNDAPYRFGTLVCFDWIATVGMQRTCRWILADLQHQAANCQLPLSWLFIIQRNPKPSHQTFLNEVGAFFNQTEFPNALRDRACLVFANTAGKATPGRTDEFGGSSVVLSHQCGFSKPKCALTFSCGGPRFRDGSDLLSDYKDVFFRERGACIHSFAQINPGSLTAGPAGRSLPVENAHVCPISGVPEPRAPAAPVPACVKWLNDELDLIPSLGTRYSCAALASQVEISHHRSVAALRAILPQAATCVVELAAAESDAEHADDWDRVEAEALEHVVHTLDIIGISFTLVTVGVNSTHAAVSINDKVVDLLAIRGASHERCIEHAKRFSPHPQRQVLLVSRDADNTAWQPRFGSILEPEPRPLGQERKITDPASGSLHLGYQRLLEVFRHSTTAAAFEGAINAELAA